MKIALLNCPNLLHSREEALLKILNYLPYASKAGCSCLFLPKNCLGKNDGEEDLSLPILEKRTAFYGMTLGLGYRKEDEEGYLVFCPERRFIPFQKGAFFQERGRSWDVLSEKEAPQGNLSLLFVSQGSLNGLEGAFSNPKDCFCFCQNNRDFSCGVIRNGKLLCSIPKNKEALLVKEVLL